LDRQVMRRALAGYRSSSKADVELSPAREVQGLRDNHRRS
jgi:hypothetical protein